VCASRDSRCEKERREVTQNFFMIVHNTQHREKWSPIQARGARGADFLKHTAADAEQIEAIKAKYLTTYVAGMSV
jgi:hypothetical protein